MINAGVSGDGDGWRREEGMGEGDGGRDIVDGWLHSKY